MMFRFADTASLLTRTVTGTDADGNDVYGSAATVVAGCAFDPGLSNEIIGGRDMVTTQPTLYMPAGTVVGPVDRVTVRGDTYEVDGSPDEWTGPFTGWNAGVVVKLRQVTG